MTNLHLIYPLHFGLQCSGEYLSIIFSQFDGYNMTVLIPNCTDMSLEGIEAVAIAAPPAPMNPALCELCIVDLSRVIADRA